MARRLGGFPLAQPSTAGLDPVVLKQFRSSVRHETETLGSLAGVCHIVLHRGHCVFSSSGGWADRANGVRFGLRTLCRLHGATKPLIAAAFLTLVDAGKCRLGDPISKFIRFPDAAAGKEGRGGSGRRGGAKRITPPVRRRATLRDLLTMTAGLGYEDFRSYRPLMAKVRGRQIHDLTALCDALAELPLKSAPGTRYDYSFCHDLLGRLCEVISGKSLDRFLHETLLEPVGMTDTHFELPQRKKRRASQLYVVERRHRRRSGNQKTIAARRQYELKIYRHKHRAPGIRSCGGGILSYLDAGMWSSACDYAKFCQMVLDGGVAPGGRRVLRPTTARALWADALAPLGRDRDGRLPGWHDSDGPRKGSWWDFRGLSLLHAYLDHEEAPRAHGRAPRRSSSMWFSGGGGAFWTIDSARQLVTVSFSQSLGGREDENDGHGPLAYRVSPYV